MSRFADPSATRLIDFGECLCPGAPHESDWAKIRAEASSTDVRRFAGMQSLEDDAVAEGLVSFIPEWNLLGPNGQDWPPSRESLLALKLSTVSVLINAIGEVIAESSAIPNASGVPSAASSRGSASHTRRQSRKPST